jgi:hypothetical protein
VSEQGTTGGKGKRINAAAMLARMPDVSLERLTPAPTPEEGSPAAAPAAPPVERGGGADQPAGAAAEPTRPATSGRATPRRKATPARKPPATALKLPPALTAELRSTMVYLRGHGTWDASMSSIAQAGVRYELDRLKAEFGIDAFPPFP